MTAEFQIDGHRYKIDTAPSGNVTVQRLTALGALVAHVELPDAVLHALADKYAVRAAEIEDAVRVPDAGVTVTPAGDAARAQRDTLPATKESTPDAKPPTRRRAATRKKNPALKKGN